MNTKVANVIAVELGILILAWLAFSNFSGSNNPRWQKSRSRLIARLRPSPRSPVRQTRGTPLPITLPFSKGNSWRRRARLRRSSTERCNTISSSSRRLTPAPMLAIASPPELPPITPAFIRSR